MVLRPFGASLRFATHAALLLATACTTSRGDRLRDSTPLADGGPGSDAPVVAPPADAAGTDSSTTSSDGSVVVPPNDGGVVVTPPPPDAGRDAGPTCTPETEAAFCARLGRDCDLVSGYDNCGTARTANCGSCTTPETCGGDGIANVCGLCVAETDAELCARGSFDCGFLDVIDRCGVRRYPSCGTCPSAADPCIVSSTCSSNRCVTVTEPDGRSCGDPGTVTDRNSCRAGACVRPVAYCDYISGGWAYQSDGVGAWYYEADCSCASSTRIRYIPLSVVGHPTQEAACSACVALGARRVCF
jgi:hypothetical protein